ncbi:hypothetical protein, partial [Mesorhizobium sp.]
MRKVLETSKRDFEQHSATTGGSDPLHSSQHLTSANHETSRFPRLQHQTSTGRPSVTAVAALEAAPSRQDLPALPTVQLGGLP